MLLVLPLNSPPYCAYFDLESGAVRSEPGGLRAIFAEWELTLSDEQPKTLLRVQASNP
jgi:hypothetical protein